MKSHDVSSCPCSDRHIWQDGFYWVTSWEGLMVRGTQKAVCVQQFGSSDTFIRQQHF